MAALKDYMAMKVNAEKIRLEASDKGVEDWRLWGPYLSERAWGTVREDYSPLGTVWEDFSHEQSRSRTYRWNEDGMGGISDKEQRLCFSLSLWNGVDPILKERAFGLTGNQGNHGEDVKEYYFYLDATPSHSFLRYLYKYPQVQYPYRKLVEENGRRTHSDPPFSLIDAGVFDGNRYWDVEIQYAKAAPEEIYIRIIAVNRGIEEESIHILPTLWFRNTWAWGDVGLDEKPVLMAVTPPDSAQWTVNAVHPTLGDYYLYGRQPSRSMFTENETNNLRLWGTPNIAAFVKDAFHLRVVDNIADAVNPANKGTKFAAWHTDRVSPGEQVMIEMVLSSGELASPFSKLENVFVIRESEADEFYNGFAVGATSEDKRIMRQALAGMIWSRQYYNFDVARWQDGDRVAPPEIRKRGRNARWRHLSMADIISMPDKWEYPWFASWDLSFHCAVLAIVDRSFAKEQIELLLRENCFHPNGQIPAYEWSFDDANPPVLAAGALKVFNTEREDSGRGDLNFLHRVFNKLLMNFTWWINRKDSDGRNVFEGGFMGLDNISVYNRSQPLPPGYILKQSDSTGWMAMFAVSMTVIALELAVEDRDFEEIAIQCYTQFLAIVNAVGGHAGHCVSLWDDDDGFFKDLIVSPEGECHRLDVFSWVGIIPLFACEVVGPRLLANVPRFSELLKSHTGGLFDGHHICECPTTVNDRNEHMLSLVDHKMLPRILNRLLNEEEFLSRYGIRSVSKIHSGRRESGIIPGIGEAFIEYAPGESTSGLFGGNSNWRGPVWMPTNFLLIEALEKFHRYLGDNFRVQVPCMGMKDMTLKEVAALLSGRLIDIFRRDSNGLVPAFAETSPFQHDRYWMNLSLFNEFFHGETGMGLGASHQTGWTGLVANLICRRY